MKIVSYNIHHCTQIKVDKLLSMEADVFIVPELSSSEHIILPDDYAMLWVGDNSRQKKGLGVIYKKESECHIANWYNPIHEYTLPLLYNGIIILAMWPTKTNHYKAKSYPQIAIEAINEYLKHFINYKVFIAGDFNCYVGQSGENPTTYSIKKIFELLEQNNIYSLYHSIYNEPLGKESTPTFYYRFHKDKPFFIDYAFSNFDVKSFEVATWNRQFSDHCALITKF